jgi:hypothetical protein
VACRCRPLPAAWFLRETRGLQAHMPATSPRPGVLLAPGEVRLSEVRRLREIHPDAAVLLPPGRSRRRCLAEHGELLLIGPSLDPFSCR